MDSFDTKYFFGKIALNTLRSNKLNISGFNGESLICPEFPCTGKKMWK